MPAPASVPLHVMVGDAVEYVPSAVTDDDGAVVSQVLETAVAVPAIPAPFVARMESFRFCPFVQVRPVALHDPDDHVASVHSVSHVPSVLLHTSQDTTPDCGSAKDVERLKLPPACVSFAVFAGVTSP